jgi:hypothetical protein
MILMLDAARVIEIRLRMMAIRMSTPNEMVLMGTEKIDALEEAKTILMRGGSPCLVIDNYQKIVAAKHDCRWINSGCLSWLPYRLRQPSSAYAKGVTFAGCFSYLAGCSAPIYADIRPLPWARPPWTARLSALILTGR